MEEFENPSLITVRTNTFELCLNQRKTEEDETEPSCALAKSYKKQNALKYAHKNSKRLIKN